jgi:selenide,water dikinase
MCEGSALSAQLHYGAIPKLPSALHYIKQHIIPDATYRNWNAYSNVVEFMPGVDATEAFMLLPDPQTNGGLLLSVSSTSVEPVIAAAKEHGTTLVEIGFLQEATDKRIMVNP